MVKVPFIVRQPGTVPAGVRSDALQSLVDLSPSLLGHLGLPIPRTMTGLDQSPVWRGEQERVRDHCLIEDRHEPDTIHVKTYVDDRHKLIVYYRRDYGQLYDLREDPGEVNNLWDDPDSQPLKHDLILRLLYAEMGKEPVWMPRVWGA
jgi:uncharacterized sulfatase